MSRIKISQLPNVPFQDITDSSLLVLVVGTSSYNMTLEQLRDYILPPTDNRQPTTNNQQPTTTTTDNRQPTTNNQQPTTTNKKQTTRNKKQLS